MYRLKKKFILSIIVFILYYLYLSLNYINLLLKSKDNTKIYALFQIYAINNFYNLIFNIISLKPIILMKNFYFLYKKQKILK